MMDWCLVDTPSRARSQHLSLAGLIGGIAATVAVTPELREAGGTDVIFEPPDLGPFGRGLLLAISVVAAGVILWALTSGNRIGGPPRRIIEVTAVSVAVGVLAGLGYRIVTAKSGGANIGGGLVLLASPFAAMLFFGYVAARLLGMRASGDTRQRHG
jgi:hypothetical protein